jgi:hypothetical protein
MHSAEAFRSAEVEAPLGHDQHVETGQQTAHIELTLIIDEPLQDDDADSGEGGQAFHLKADSESGRWRTAFR